MAPAITGTHAAVTECINWALLKSSVTLLNT
jgi:hypothetical protein